MSQSPMTDSQLINFIALQSMALNQADRFYTSIQEALVEAGVDQASVDKLFIRLMGGLRELETIVRKQLDTDQAIWYDICVRNNSDIEVRGQRDAKAVYSMLLPLLQIYGKQQAIKVVEALNAAKKELEKKDVNGSTA